MVIFDQIRKTILVVAQAPTQTGDLRAAYDKACAQVDELCNCNEGPPICS